MDREKNKKPSWFEDPRLDALTPGQRYTGLIVVMLAVLMLRFGVPRGGPAAALRQGSLPGPSPTTSIVPVTVPASPAVPSPPVAGADVSSPPDAAVVPATDSAPTEADTAQTPSTAPSPPPPPPAPTPPTTTTTTQPCTVPSVPGVPSVLCGVP